MENQENQPTLSPELEAKAISFFKESFKKDMPKIYQMIFDNIVELRLLHNKRSVGMAEYRLDKKHFTIILDYNILPQITNPDNGARVSTFNESDSHFRYSEPIESNNPLQTLQNKGYWGLMEDALLADFNNSK